MPSRRKASPLGCPGAGVRCRRTHTTGYPFQGCEGRTCWRRAVEVHRGRAVVGRVADARKQAAAGRERAVVGRRGRQDARERAHRAQREHADGLVVVRDIQPQLVCAAMPQPQPGTRHVAVSG